MSLPFLTADEQREFELRLVRALDPEEKRHIQTRGKKTQDAISDGTLHTTIYVGNLEIEGVQHIRNVGQIIRGELLGIVQGKGRRLRAKEVASISRKLREQLQPRVGKLTADIDAAVRDWPPHLNMTRGASGKFEAALRRECEDELHLQVADMHRSQTADRSKRRSERVEKLVWIVAGAVVGVCVTLFAQWVRGRG